MAERSNRNQDQKSNGPEGQVQDLSRRKFLNSAGCAAIGGLAVATGAGLLNGNSAGATAQPEAPQLPWKYEKLDPKEAGKRGYENYLLQGG